MRHKAIAAKTAERAVVRDGLKKNWRSD